jgi:ribonucleoside-diphosphate reductase beta chain
VGLEPLHQNLANPLPWLSEMMEIKKETNFFEGRVTEYRRGVDLAGVSDDEL